MAFPNTPASLISRLKDRSSDPEWHDSWRKFFDLYHGALKASVLRAFDSCGWHRVDDSLLQETIANVVVSFCRSQEKNAHDPAKGHLRNYLAHIATWRVKDQIERQQAFRGHVSLDVTQEGEKLHSEVSKVDLDQWKTTEMALTKQEQEAHDRALLATLLEDVRSRVSPRNFLIFDIVKLQHKSPEEVAKEFRVTRHVVDNAVYKVLQKLRELASQKDYRQEISS